MLALLLRAIAAEPDTAARLDVLGAPEQEAVWVTEGESAVRIDPYDGHLIEQGAPPAPGAAGDLVPVVGPGGVVLLDAHGRPLAVAPVAARAATFVSGTLWVLTGRELQRFSWTGDRLTRGPAVVVMGVAHTSPCGDHVCVGVGSVRWDPFLGTRALSPPPVRPPGPMARERWHLVGEPAGDLALRAVPDGTHVVDLASGRDVGALLPCHASAGAVSADGALAILADDTHTALFEVATGRERWSLPAPTSPHIVTAAAFTADQGRLLVDTATGRVAYVVASEVTADGTGWIAASLHPSAGEWWTAGRRPSGPPAASLAGGEALLSWTPVTAPVPVWGAAADDPLRRAWARLQKESPPDLHAGLPNLLAEASARQDRLDELVRVLGRGKDGDPLGRLVVTPAWPEAAGAAPELGVPSRLRPGRSVRAPQGFGLPDGSELTLPLSPGRATLVVVGTDGGLPPALAATAHDPTVDLLWALSGEFGEWRSAQSTTTLDPTRGATGLAALFWDRDPARTLRVVRNGERLAQAYGLPDPGAMLVDGRGRVLARGTVEDVAAAVRGRDLRRPAPLLAPLWAYEGPEPIHRLAALEDGGVAFLAEDTVGVLDPNGALRWRTPASATRLATSGDAVVTSVEPEPVRHGGPLTVRAAADGTTRWTDHVSLRAAGRSWMLVHRDSRLAPGHSPESLTRLVATRDGATIRLSADVADPSSRGDELWFDGPGDTRCGWDVGEERSLGCGADPDTPRFVRQGSPSGPWETRDGRTSVVSDVPPVVAGDQVYGTVDGVIVAWALR